MAGDRPAEFRRTGLLRLPGAVPAHAAAAMADRIWQHLRHRHGTVRDRPETWRPGPQAGLRAVTGTPEFQALGSPAIRAAADDLLGAGRWQVPRRWGRPLVTFPSPDAPWDLPTGAAWHNDFVPLRPDAGLRAVQVFVILQDLPERGGGTVVLTGSHHLVSRYIAATGEPPHPRRLRGALGAENPWLRELWDPPPGVSAAQRIRRFMTGGTRTGDGELRVVELTGRAGDAYVMHCDTFHAAAPNRGDRPRLMATTILLAGPPEHRRQHLHAGRGPAPPDRHAR